MNQLARHAALPLLLGALALPGCSPEGLDPELSREAQAYDFSLYFTVYATGATRVKEYPYFSGSYAPRLHCAEAVTRQEVTRTTCVRESETLEVLFWSATRQAVVIHRPTGAAGAAQTFATCTTKSKKLPLPTSLRCTRVTPDHDPSSYTSPIPSSVEGVAVPNAHWVGASGMILRGMELRSPAAYDEIVAAGIEADLIFKKSTGFGPSVSAERKAFTDRGLDEEDVSYVPITWKNFPDFRTPCRQTLDGLRFIQEQTQAGHPVFLHCTVGEDRTGTLAGLLRLLGGETDVAEIFQDELCERGYSSGNPLKPPSVTGSVDAWMTPLYLKMAYKIATGALTTGTLAAPSVYALCDDDPAGEPGFDDKPLYQAPAYRCGTSSLFAAHLLQP